MTRTLLATRFDGELFGLVWKQADPWAWIFSMLEMIDAERVALGAVTGELQLDGHGDPSGEIWPIAVDTAGREALRKRLSEAAGPVPYELRLRCQPLVFLADDRIEVVGIDTGDDWELGEVPMVRVSEVSAPTGLHGWRIVGEPRQMEGDSLLTLSALFSGFTAGGEIGMSVISYCDLWRSKTLEGRPNEPAGRASARMLVERFLAIAAASGATMRDGELRVHELMR